MPKKLYTSGSNEHFTAVITALALSGKPYPMALAEQDAKTLIDALHHCAAFAPEQALTPDVRNTVQGVFEALCDRLQAPNGTPGVRRIRALRELRLREEKLDLRLEMPDMCAALAALHYAGYHGDDSWLAERAASFFSSVSATFGIEAV